MTRYNFNPEIKKNSIEYQRSYVYEIINNVVVRDRKRRKVEKVEKQNQKWPSTQYILKMEQACYIAKYRIIPKTKRR